MILLAVGGFFAVLSAVFALLAWRDSRANDDGATIRLKVRRRLALVFALVAVGLPLLSLVLQRPPT